MPAWVYILRLTSKNLYTGSTTQLEKRISDHFSGRGCRTTRIDPPILAECTEQFTTMHDALQRERQVKKWSRAKKEALIRGNFETLKHLSKKKKPQKLI
jgi:putative endonuclease